MLRSKLPGRQRGITAIGFAFILALVGMIGYAGFIVTPIYLETTKVDTILKDVEAQFAGKPTNASQIRSVIEKRLNVESVTSVNVRNFVVKPVNRQFEVGVAYDREVRYAGNLYLTVKYDKTVEVKQ